MSASRPMSEDLLYLPDDVRQEELYRCSPLAVLGLLALTSKQLEEETAFSRLLPSIIDAEPKSYKPESYEWADETKLAAIAILKKHPELLFKIGQVTDHFGRKIKGSPYRLLLGTGDAWALKQIHEKIIAKIKDPEVRASFETHAKAAFHEQFPHYKEVCGDTWPPLKDMPEEALYDERNRTQMSEVSEKLKIIVQKIGADPCTYGQATRDETTQAVSDLCKIFVPKEGEVIQTGLHFPLGILMEMFKTYDAYFQPWCVDQLSFFSRTVIGGTIAALSAVDGQCVKQGLANLNREVGPDRRDGLFCKHPKGVPGDKAPLGDKLGKTLFVDPDEGVTCIVSNRRAGFFDCYDKKGRGPWVAEGLVFDGAPGGWENLWRTIVENKSRILWELLCSHTKRSHNTVSMPMTNRRDA